MNYRRAAVAGVAYFFTVNLANRGSCLLTEQVGLLRETVREVRQTHPFEIEAMVVLPEHFHAVWWLLRQAQHQCLKVIRLSSSLDADKK